MKVIVGARDGNLVIMALPTLCHKAVLDGIVFAHQENAQHIEVMGKTGSYWAKLWPSPEGKLRIVCDMNGEMIETAASGGIMIDIGAMHGRYSVPMASKAVVYSFEPHPDNFKFLQEVCSLSPERSKIIPVNKAVSDKNGTASMFLSKRTPEHSLIKHFTTDTTIEVETITLDSFFNEIKDTRPITGIKIDVEGLEEQVLRGAQETIRKHDPLIVFESHSVDCSNIYSILSECGYKVMAPNGELVTEVLPNCQYICSKHY